MATPKNINPSFGSMFDNILCESNGDWGRPPTPAYFTTMPQINIHESADIYELEMAAPGLAKTDFSITLEQNLLTISSERSEERKTQCKQYTKREFTMHSFRRSFTLPKRADGDNIIATCKNGILKVSIPKLTAEHPYQNRCIDIT